MMVGMICILSILAQDAGLFKPAGDFRAEGNFTILSPRGEPPESMGEKVLLVGDKNLECWGLEELRMLWSVPLTAAAIDVSTYLFVDYLGPYLHVRGGRASYIVDLTRGKEV